MDKYGLLDNDDGYLLESNCLISLIISIICPPYPMNITVLLFALPLETYLLRPVTVLCNRIRILAQEILSKSKAQFCCDILNDFPKPLHM